LVKDEQELWSLGPSYYNLLRYVTLSATNISPCKNAKVISLQSWR